MKPLLAAVLWLASPAFAGDCADEHYIAGRLSLASISAAPLTALTDVFRLAEESASKCPREGNWYILLRTAEVRGEWRSYLEDSAGSGPAVIEAPPRKFRSLAEAAAWSWRQFPGSVRIAALAARSDGSVEAGRRAVETDHGYAPAQVALASALLRRGEAEEAGRVLEKVSQLDRVQGGLLLSAKIRKNLGDRKGAASAGRRAAESHPTSFYIEPGAGDLPDVQAAREFLKSL